MRNRLLLSALLLCCSPALTFADSDRAAEPTTRPEVYGQGVRETDARTPEQERQGFHLPDGFEAQLFAAEPQIAKPLNMAWDARGRLWVTNTIEYPYPAKADSTPRDSIKILEDTDGDGAADRVTTFAEGLNIPMGLLPVPGGVICFDIPNLVFLKDNDGDDRSDERIKILGPFDTTRDTHGMINALRRGADGWIYACHGFNNQSNVTAADGSNVKLISGNTFRFKPDGSRVEQFTSGQVNPFGMTSDSWGNWYTADCHSKPITALLPGGCYPSFGRKHDGLGFAPSMMDHLHGSTAICGIVYYQGENFPTAFRERFYSGNVMTSRINCNALVRNGANVTARELPDFMTSDDPWFRPVDIQIAPDGSLAVADFYNKIIGHYEVPLEHPERDRTSGRIWRIYYRGSANPAELNRSLTEYGQQASRTNGLDAWNREELASLNPTRRQLAIERVCQLKLDESQRKMVRSWMLDGQSAELLRLSCVSILWRHQALDATAIDALLKSDSARLVVEGLRTLPEVSSATSTTQHRLVSNLIDHAEPQVRLAAVECLGKMPALAAVPDVHRLVRLADASSSADITLRHAARIATRNLLRNAELLEKVVGSWKLGKENATTESQLEIVIQHPLAMELAHVLPGLESPLAKEALLSFATKHPNCPQELRREAIEGGARLSQPAAVEALIGLVKQMNPNQPIEWTKTITTISTTIQANKAEYPTRFQSFVSEVAQDLRTQIEGTLAQTPFLVDWRSPTGADWKRESRACTDGQTISVYSSLTLGEAYTGRFVTGEFNCPNELSLWICGHNGPPAEADNQKNLVRLIDANDASVLVSQYPPRNDQARQVRWDLSKHVGKKVQLEIVDGDNGSAYAWIAVGRISEIGLNPSNIGEQLDALRQLVSLRVSKPVTDHAIAVLASSKLSPKMSAQVIASVADAMQASLLASVIDQAVEMGRSELVHRDLLGDSPTAAQAFDELLKQVCLAATQRQQSAFAGRLLKAPEGVSRLIALLDQGRLNLACLRNKKSLMPKGLEATTEKKLSELIAQADQLPDTEKKIVQERLAKVDLNHASTEQGQILFEKNCATCHQLKGKGALVGPQLDGVGKRGVERLCEDILDPHRNVDTAFRMSVLITDDDRVLSGLVKEQTDGSLQVIGQDGKSTQISAAAVTQRRDSTKSVMPENFVEVLNDSDLSAILKFLTQ